MADFYLRQEFVLIQFKKLFVSGNGAQITQRNVGEFKFW